jgi:hypothetical protein
MDAIQRILSEEQIETKTVQYNEGYAQLTHMRDWWNSLSEGDQIKKANRNKLVQTTETIISAVMAAQYAVDEEAAEEEKQDEEEEEASAVGGWCDDDLLCDDELEGAEDGCVHQHDPTSAEAAEAARTKRAGDILKVPQPSPDQPRSKMSSHFMFLSEKKTKLATALSVPYTSNIKEVPPSTLYNFLIKDIISTAATRNVKAGDASQSTNEAANPAGEECKMGMVMVAGTGVLGMNGVQNFEGDGYEVPPRQPSGTLRDGVLSSALALPSGSKEQPSESPGAQGRTRGRKILRSEKLLPLQPKSAMSGAKPTRASAAAVLESKVDQFLGRGLGEAFSQAVLAGRRCVLLTRGKDTEVVSRVTKAIDCWQLPAVFVVGVSFFEESEDEADVGNAALSIDVGSLNGNTHRQTKFSTVALLRLLVRVPYAIVRKPSALSFRIASKAKRANL